MHATSVFLVAAMLWVGEMSTGTNSFDVANANPEPERNLSAWEIDRQRQQDVLQMCLLILNRHRSAGSLSNGLTHFVGQLEWYRVVPAAQTTGLKKVRQCDISTLVNPVTFPTWSDWIQAELAFAGEIP